MVGAGIEERITKLLSKHDYGLTIEEIANTLGINRMTASKYLAILEATRQIAVRDVGKAKLHYPKTKNVLKWMKLDNRKSSCGLSSVGFVFLFLFFLTTAVIFITSTAANNSDYVQGFEVTVARNYPDKLIVLEIAGPPLADFSMILLNPENKSISPKGNVSFRTDQEGKYELHLIGFVPGAYTIRLESNGTEYVQDFEIEPLEGFKCNRSFLEYVTENVTNATETNEPVAGRYVWDICRNFVEVDIKNATNETTGRTFVEQELDVKKIAENRTFLENETITNETIERSFIEQEVNVTEIAENRTFMENNTLADHLREKILSRGSNYDLTFSGGVYKKVYYLNVYNYYDGSEYVPINTTVVNKSFTMAGRDYNFGVDRGLYEAYFRDQSSDVKNRPVVMVKDGYVLTFSPQDYITYEPHKKTTEGVIGSIQESDAVVVDSSVTYPEQYREIGSSDGFANLTYEYQHTRIKEELVIWDQDYLREMFDSQCDPEDADTVNLVFKNTIRTYYSEDLDDRTLGVFYGSGRKKIKDFGLAANERQTTSEDIYFTDQNNRTIYYIPKVYAYDSNGSSILLNKTISISGFGNLRVDILTPFSWLNSNERVYPVIIDPTANYNFSAEQNIKAWMCDNYDGNVPPVSGPYPGCIASLVDATSQPNLDSPEGSTYNFPDVANGAEDYLIVDVDIQENENAITKLNFTWRGTGEATEPVIHFHMWNDTKGSWWGDCTSTHSGTGWSWRSCVVTSIPGHFINSSGNAVFMIQGVRTAAPNREIRNDFIKLEVSYYNPPAVSGVTDNGPVYAGQNATFSATVTDDENDNVGITVCRTNVITDGYPGTCDSGQELCNKTGIASGQTVSCNYTTISSDIGTLNYYVFGCEAGASLCSSGTGDSIAVKTPVIVKQQQTVPQHAKNNTNVNISANVTHALGGTIDKVIAMINYPNGTDIGNYSMTSGGGTIYWNASYVTNFYPHGRYNVTIWANDTNGNRNSSQKTWFAPYLNLSREKNMTINGSFTDWAGVEVVTDNGTDAGAGGPALDNELLFTGMNNDAGNISIFEWNGTSYLLKWSTDTPYIVGQSPGGEIGDVNRDEVNDFVLCRAAAIGNYTLEVWTYNSTSQEWYNLWKQFGFSAYMRVGDIGDFDNDTYNEFLVTNEGNDDIEVWGNDTEGATSFSLNATVKNCATVSYFKAAGDMDGDGIPEIVSHCFQDANIEIFEYNPGTGQYAQVGTVAAPLSRTGGSPVIDDMECGDVDRGDAVECVFCGNSGRSHVLDYSGSYSIVYNSPMTPTTDSAPQTCSVGDLTNDGYLDWFDASWDDVRVFSYTGGAYVNIWNSSDLGFDTNPPIGGSFTGDADNDEYVEFIHATPSSADKYMLWENDTANAVSFENTLTFSSTSAIGNTIIGDFDTDAGGSGGGADFDITNVSLAHNDSYLFARIAVNGSIDVSEAANYYRMFISVDDSVGNESTPENEDLPFKYDYRVQVNGSKCYVYNYSDYSNNVSSCLFNYSGSQMEIGVNLTVINLSAGKNANITFQTGSMNPGGYDSAPDGKSFLSYDIPGVGGPSVTALGGFTGPATINENESTTYAGNCTCSGGTCEETFIRIQDNRTGSWSNSVTSHENVSVNVTSYYIGSLGGTSGNYPFNVTGNSSGVYNFRAVCNTSSATEDPSDASLLVVSPPCTVDFQMTTQLQLGIRFDEQDPNKFNVSAADNGDYNVTDQSTSGCGTVNVSIRATGDLMNESYTIGIGNVTVNSTSPNTQTIQLSTSYQLIRSGVPAGESNITALYFWLTIPSGQDPKTYNTTIEIKEEKG